MPAGAATCISGAKANQESAHNHHNNSTCGEQRLPRKNVFRNHAAVIGNTITSQFAGQLGFYFYWFRVGQYLAGNDAAYQYSPNKKQAPHFLLPVVLKKRNARGHTSCAYMSQ